MRGLRTWIEIDAQALRHNAAEFRKLIGPRTALMAVVKSNAYGHGLVQVAKLLASYQPPASSSQQLWFGVDSIVEALRLRREGIKNPILVLGYTLPARIRDAARGRVSVTISNFEALAAWARSRHRPAFHLKFDTGMHRQGFQEREMPELIRAINALRLVPEGVYSHYAAAENAALAKEQRSAFERCLAALRRAGIRPKCIHMSSTGSAVRGREGRDTIIRVGLGNYGYLPNGRRGVLRPVLSWKTIVGEVKRVKKGERIGYDLTERLKRDSMIAILPIGYWHGFDRGLSSIGEVLIRGKRAKVMGRVSMDMVAVDVTDIDRELKGKSLKVKVGEEAVLIGHSGREFIGADDIAKKIGTSAYEVLTRINPLIRRVVR